MEPGSNTIKKFPECTGLLQFSILTTSIVVEFKKKLEECIVYFTKFLTENTNMQMTTISRKLLIPFVKQAFTTQKKKKNQYEITFLNETKVIKYINETILPKLIEYEAKKHK